MRRTGTSTCVTGISFRSPPNCRMSMTFPIACMTDPEPRKSNALKKACVTRWKMAAVTARARRDDPAGARGP